MEIMFMIQNNIKKIFFKSLFSFGAVQVISQMVSFFLLPLYTARLSPADYGVMEYVSILNTVLLIIFSFQAHQGVIRYLVDATTQEDKEKIVSTCFWFTIASFILLVCGQTITYIMSNKQWYYSEGYKNLLPITLGSLLLTAINSYLNSILVWSLKSVQSALISAISIFVNIGLAIYFVLYLNMGIKGTLMASLIAQIIILPFLVFTNWQLLKLQFDMKVLRQVLKFSVPIIFSVLAYYSWFFIDRYLLSRYLGEAELGIFSVAMRFAAPIGLVLTVVETAVFPIVLNNYKDDKTKVFLSSLFDIITFGFTILLLFVCCFSKDIFNLMLHGDFIQGHRFCLLLCLGQLFSKMYYFNPGFAIEKKTSIFLYITIISSAINFCINILLIPKFGILGACIATSCSSFVYFIILFFYSNKYYSIKYFYKNPIINVVLLLSSYFYLIYSQYQHHILVFILMFTLLIVLNIPLIKRNLTFIHQIMKNKKPSII
jgi:O-antigen/teichoic acid export membrane protein